MPGQSAQTRTTTLVLATAVFAATVTLLISVLPFVAFAYRSVEAHLAIETTATLAAGLVAVLVYGRFRRTRLRSDLILLAAMLAFAGTNLAFSVMPPVTGLARDGAIATWAPVFSRLISAALFAWAAFAADVRVRRSFERPRVVVALVLAMLCVIGTTVALVGGALPEGLDPTLSPESAERPRVVGSPLLLAQFVVVMSLFAAAAVGFLRRAEAHDDGFSGWLAAAAVLGSFARLNYFLFPSLYSEWVYTGDVLRLGFFAMLCVGAAREITRAQRAEAATAVLEERRRLAREIHDGLAQELTFIVAHARRLGDRAVGRRAEQLLVLEQLREAAERALAEARSAIEVLATPTDEPLGQTLCRSVEYVAERLGGRVRCRAVNGEVSVPPQQRETLVRLVREAATNAVRHGRAQLITLEVDGSQGLRVRIADDGSGFDPATIGDGGFGLTSMRERAEALGGTFKITSAVGIGTTVEVEIP